MTKVLCGILGRRCSLRRLKGAALLASMFWLLAPPAWAACPVSLAAVDEARKAEDAAALRALFDRIAVEPECDDDMRQRLARAAAFATEKAVYKAVTEGEALAAKEQDLRQSLRFQRRWRALAWLGDIARDRGDYADASLYYQEALIVIGDTDATPRPPPEEAIATVFHAAEQTRMLADRYVKTPTTRSGLPGGLGATSIRGFGVESVALPIEFEFNSTVMTEKGREAANDLLGILKAEPQGPITLVGHTDERGSSDYNKKLSIRRAAAVVDFLKQGGYRGEIRPPEGHGSEVRPDVGENYQRYTKDQWYQICRRVEMRRG